MCEVRSLPLCLAKVGLLASQTPQTLVLKTPFSLEFKVMQSQSTLYFMLLHFLSDTEKGSKARILQFASAVSDSGLGSFIQKLSEGEKVELGQRYLTDYVLLSFKVRSEEEHWVRYKGFVSMATNWFSHISRISCSNVGIYGCVYFFILYYFFYRSFILQCGVVCLLCRWRCQ